MVDEARETSVEFSSLLAAWNKNVSPVVSLFVQKSIIKIVIDDYAIDIADCFGDRACVAVDKSMLPACVRRNATCKRGSKRADNSRE